MVPVALLVAFGLFLAVPDGDGPTQYSVPYTETKLVPKVSHVLSSTDAVEPRSEPAEHDQSGIGEKAEGTVATTQNVEGWPAAFADMHGIEYTVKYLPYRNVCAFDDEGNLYGGSENYVFKADVSEGVITKWIIPDDYTFGECMDTDSLGQFYFTAYYVYVDSRTLFRLNPANNSFTSYGLTTDSLIVDSNDDVYLYQSGYAYVLQGDRQARVFVDALRVSVEYDEDDEYYQCNDRCEDVYDACSGACDNTYDACVQTCTTQSCANACGSTLDQCSDACIDEGDACDDVCYSGPGRIDENDSVSNIIYFRGSGVSGPAIVSVLSSDSSVLGTASVLPDRHGIVYGEIKVPTDIASGTYNRESGIWNIPPGPYSTTGRHTLVLQDLSQTVSTEFELDPDRIITPAPQTLDRHSGGTYFHRALVAKLDTDTSRLTTFYGNISDSRYDVIALDPSDRLHLSGQNYVARFDPDSNKLLEWYIGSAGTIHSYGAYDKKVYYTEYLQHRTMLTELDTEENTLRKWTMPYHRSPSSIAVDSQGNVFLAFGGSAWLRFVPSTGTFVEFYGPGASQFQIGPQDVLYWAASDGGGTIR